VGFCHYFPPFHFLHTPLILNYLVIVIELQIVFRKIDSRIKDCEIRSIFLILITFTMIYEYKIQIKLGLKKKFILKFHKTIYVLQVLNFSVTLYILVKYQLFFFVRKRKYVSMIITNKSWIY